MRSFLAELRRRNVLRAGALYIAAVWALAQGISQLGSAIGAPEWATRWFLVAAAIGFPLFVAFAWFYEFTPQGWKRETPIDPVDPVPLRNHRKLDIAIIGVLAVALVLLLTDRFVLHHGVNEEATIPVSDKSIAVLPFVNGSGDKSNEYFSDGISEDLLNLLTKIPQLQVTARTSSFSFKGKSLAIPEIARRLHVAYVLEGSVRKERNTVRITAQLISAARDTQLWSQSYDRQLDDIFKIQDEIAADVVKQLKVTLLGSAPKARVTDPEAYALFLQAGELARQNSADAFRESDALYLKVVEIDPNYAPAWDGMSTNFINETSMGLLPIQEAFTRARAAAMKAIAIDPEYAPAYAGLGWIAMTGDNDIASAARYYERALALDPSDLSVLGGSAVLLLSLGRLDQALALEMAVVRRDPVDVANILNLAGAQRATGRLDAAIASYRTALSLSPGRGGARYNLGESLMLNGDATAALAQMEQETSEPLKLIGETIAQHALGRQAESKAALTALIAKYDKDWAYNIAYVYAFLGDADQAFAWLDKAVETGDPGLSEIVMENLFDKIRTDPRWLPFLRKLGKAPEQLAEIPFKVTLPLGNAPTGD